jgi:hypothetical protein
VKAGGLFDPEDRGKIQRYWVFGMKKHNLGVFPHLRTETDPVSETLCFFIII